MVSIENKEKEIMSDCIILLRAQSRNGRSEEAAGGMCGGRSCVGKKTSNVISDTLSTSRRGVKLITGNTRSG